MLTLKAIPFALLLAQVSDSDMPRQFKDGHDYVLSIAKKMPAWDEDVLGQFERLEIAQVKEDIAAALQEQDPDDFLIDVKQLEIDVDILQVLDNSLHIERVI